MIKSISRAELENIAAETIEGYAAMNEETRAGILEIMVQAYAEKGYKIIDDDFMRDFVADYTAHVKTVKTESGAMICIRANFDGEKTAEIENKIETAVAEIARTIEEKTVYCNDLTGELWCFDYRLNCGVCCENIKPDDNLKYYDCEICV